METDLVSIIVPVYDAEQFLDRCIESALHQTYQNLEIVLVDDGSPDRCGDICDRLPRKTIGLLSFIRKMQGRRLQEILVWMLQKVTLFIFSIQMTI